MIIKIDEIVNDYNEIIDIFTERKQKIGAFYGCFYGEFNKATDISLSRVSHFVDKMWYDNGLFVDIRILNTPCGKELKENIDKCSFYIARNGIGFTSINAKLDINKIRTEKLKNILNDI